MNRYLVIIIATVVLAFPAVANSQQDMSYDKSGSPLYVDKPTTRVGLFCKTLSDAKAFLIAANESAAAMKAQIDMYGNTSEKPGCIYHMPPQYQPLTFLPKKEMYVIKGSGLGPLGQDVYRVHKVDGFDFRVPHFFITIAQLKDGFI